MTALTAAAPRIGSLNRVLDRGRLNAERRLARLEQTYERLVRDAGREAAGMLRAQTLVAAANPNWQPPPEGVLVDTDELRAKAAARLAAEHERILKETAGPALERIGISWDVSHPLAQELLAQSAQRTGAALGAAVQPVLRATIAEAYTQGLSVVDAAALIRSKIADAAPTQARMLARTDLNGLANGGSVMAAKIAGVGSKVWLTAGDERVRPDHMAANGQAVPIDQPFSVGGEQLAFPGDPAGSDEQVCNCFPADTLVEFPRLRGVTRRRYDGDLVEVALAGDDVLAGTPNHPVLRSDGLWVPLCELKEGDYLVRASFVGNDVGAPDEERPPAKMGEVYDLAQRGAEAHRIRLRPVDFHGDGGDGEVDVVAVDGSLLVDAEAATDEQVAQSGLAVADVARAAFGGALDGRVLAHASAAPATSAARGVGSRGEVAPLFDAHASEAKGVRLGTRPAGKSEFAQAPVDDVAADAESTGHREDALPALVTLTEVVGVDRRAFHGDVFNLDTGTGYYTANGVLCRNCRCTVVYEDAPVSRTAAALSEGGRNMDAMTAAVAAPTRWQAVLAVEGEPTEDGRMLAAGSITWRELPITLMAMTKTGPGGHEGAEAAGRIDEIWRDEGRIMGAGIFDAGEFGAEIARMVREQTLRGVSVDLAVREFEVRILNDDGTAGDAVEGPLDLAEGVDALFVVTNGVIGAATVCPFQAIANASITIVGSSNDAWRLERDAAFSFPGATIDDRLTAAVGTLAHVTEMAARLDQAEKRASDMGRLVETVRDEHKQETLAQKAETLALIESLTARIAAGEHISEAMLAAVGQLTERKPREVRVLRDDSGRAVGYQEVTA